MLLSALRQLTGSAELLQTQQKKHTVHYAQRSARQVVLKKMIDGCLWYAATKERKTEFKLGEHSKLLSLAHYESLIQLQPLTAVSHLKSRLKTGKKPRK